MTAYQKPARCIHCGTRLRDRWLFCTDACSEASLAELRIHNGHQRDPFDDEPPAALSPFPDRMVNVKVAGERL